MKKTVHSKYVLKTSKKKVVYSPVGFLKAPRRKKTSIKYLDESYLFTSSQLSLCIFFKRTKISG